MTGPETAPGPGPVTRRPFGSWPSPLTADALVAGATSSSEPSFDGADIYWLEGRPANGGRQTLVRRAGDGSVADLTPPEVNVRDRVHEYGGGSYVARGGTVWYSDFGDGRLHRRDADGASRPITPPGPFRYADLIVDAPRGRLISVREDHTDPAPGGVRNTLAAIPLEGGDPVVLAAGSDFYANARPSPDGTRLAWLSWDHPNLPWDETSLWTAAFAPDGSLVDRVRVAGEAGESVLQPRWSPDGVLHFVAERSGWWNLYRWVEGRIEAVAPMAAEFAHPQWRFRFSSWAFAGDGRIVGSGRHDGREHLYVIDPRTGEVRDLEVPFTEVEYVEASDGRAVFVAGAPTRRGAVVLLDLTDGSWTALGDHGPAPLDPALVSVGQPVAFPSADGRTAFGVFYPPHLPGFAGSEGELPPLVVTSHGGPTSAASTTLSTLTQMFTTRGLAVLDVDYGGSTGHGRAYRKLLEGRWGVVDVEDCAAGALWLADRGLVDRRRLAIRGGSASGFTTLCALAFRDAFAAGVSHFGLGDLETFALQTHKFESRYLDSLIGPYPERRDLYVARSPLSCCDRIRAAVLITQGLEDRIVPPEQAEQIVRVLRERHVPLAYIPFEGEDHGYRGAAAIRRAFEAELSFYGQVFGFDPADSIEPLAVENLPIGGRPVERRWTRLASG